MLDQVWRRSRMSCPHPHTPRQPFLLRPALPPALPPPARALPPTSRPLRVVDHMLRAGSGKAGGRAGGKREGLSSKPVRDSSPNESHDERLSPFASRLGLPGVSRICSLPKSPTEPRISGGSTLGAHLEIQAAEGDPLPASGHQPALPRESLSDEGLVPRYHLGPSRPFPGDHRLDLQSSFRHLSDDCIGLCIAQNFGDFTAIAYDG